ncbi:hypothetical protein BC628DRAFT_36880 [Trametes gibbosa]|nr:hypothetical protein BC628DRAFT_36880 [Trametes gibbosa]
MLPVWHTSSGRRSWTSPGQAQLCPLKNGAGTDARRCRKCTNTCSLWYIASRDLWCSLPRPVVMTSVRCSFLPAVRHLVCSRRRLAASIVRFV